MARWYYLGPWQWSTDEGGFWHAPEGTVGLIDLRPVLPVSTFGFFATDRELTDADYTAFGDAAGTRLDGLTMDVAQRKAWASALQIAETPEAGTLLDLLWNTLTIYSDPDGATHAKPIMPTHRGDLELWLGGHSLVRRERMPADPTKARHWPQMQRVLQEDYRKIREHALRSGKTKKEQELHLRVLGSMQAKYRLTPDAATELLVPSDLPREKPKRPETTITESFNTGDSSTLGPDLSWTETSGDLVVVSNHVEENGQNGIGEARAESDLSSDDHYVQADHLSSSGSSQFDETRPLGRFSASARTHYGAVAGGALSDTSYYSLFKRESGTYTSLGSTLVNDLRGTTIRLICDGSSISYTKDGVQQDSLTDTAISGNVRTGILMRNVGEADNFEAADLAAASSPVPIIMLAHGLHTGASYR